MMKRTNIFVFLIILISCKPSNLITHSSDKLENIDLLSVSILVDITPPFHKEKYNYEEGIIYIYTLNDGGHVLIHEGTLMQFEWDLYEPLKVIHYKNCSICTGETAGMVWGKYMSDNIRIFYFNVKAKNKRKYDNLLKTIKILKKSNSDTISTIEKAEKGQFPVNYQINSATGKEQQE